MRSPSAAGAICSARALLLVAAVAACRAAAPAVARPAPADPVIAVRDVVVAPADLRPAAECSAVLDRARAGQWRVADQTPRSLRFATPDELPARANGTAVLEYVLSYTVNAAGRVDRSTVTLPPDIGGWYVREMQRLAPRWRFQPAVLERCAVPYTLADTVRIGTGVRAR